MKRLLSLLAVILMATALQAKPENGSKAPIIGISSYSSDKTINAEVTYINVVRKAGGVPLIIPVTTDDAQIEAVLNAIDGLIMTGGEDFDPLRWYGEEPLRALGRIAPTRDEFDVKLVRAAVAKGIPVLGICRGEQLLAVAFGGSLWQDIPSQIPSSFVKHNQSNTQSSYGTHTVNFVKGSFFEKILGLETARVNTLHHQAIKDMPQGFMASAYSVDGIVEAVERVGKLADYPDGGAMIIGTQFHPEIITNSGDPTFLPIFKKLVSEAALKR